MNRQDLMHHQQGHQEHHQQQNLQQHHQHQKLKQFIDELQSLDEEDTKQICFKIPGGLFPFIAQQLPHEYHTSFLKGYRVSIS